MNLFPGKKVLFPDVNVKSWHIHTLYDTPVKNYTHIDVLASIFLAEDNLSTGADILLQVYIYIIRALTTQR